MNGNTDESKIKVNEKRRKLGELKIIANRKSRSLGSINVHGFKKNQQSFKYIEGVSKYVYLYWKK